MLLNTSNYSLSSCSLSFSIYLVLHPHAFASTVLDILALQLFPAMKLQHLSLAFCNEINPSSISPSSSSTSSVQAINFKHLRPLAPRVACTDDTNIITSLGLRSVESPKPAKCTEIQNQDASPSGGTRWNPTQEQIRILEELYRGGMRTPNAQQIERITAELGKYGRIEGKNVFYWFQNHKARERQRQKRSAALLTLDAPTPDPILSLFSADKLVENMSSKRKCRSWEDVWLMDSHTEGDGTLELFPLHPERESSKNKD